MSIEKLLGKLNLDDWYSILIYIGAIGFLGSLFLPIQIFNQKEIGLFLLGLFFVGLGEMKNHKHTSWIKEANIHTGGAALMSVKIRKPDFIGNLFVFIGFILIIVSILSILSIIKV